MQRTAAQHAFTLVEMMVVVVLLAIIAGAVSWTAWSTLQHTHSFEAQTAVAFIDNVVRRTAANRGEPARLVFDLTERRIYQADPAERDRGSNRLGEPIGQPVVLERDVRIRWLVVDGRPHDAGQVAIDYSTLGHSPTYAVWIARGDNDFQPRGFAVAGLTGQITELEYESQADAIFSTLRRRHAD